MVTTTSSTQYAASQPAYTHGYAGNKKTVYATAAVASTIATNDVINMFYLPAGARVTGGRLKCTDVDTNVSPAVTWDVGDSGSATRYWSASTAGQSAAVDATMAIAGVFYKNTVKTAVIITCHLQPATGAAGTIELGIDYIDEDAATSG